MTATHMFDGLRKLRPEPAARILARAGAVLQTPIEAPASAPVAQVLAELSARGAHPDMLLLLAHALPPREATWFACLCARDILPPGRAALPAPLAAAEAWVRRPGEDTRARARAAFEASGPQDETELCAMAASMADGTLGPGELEDYEAPAGAVGAAAFGMALLSLYHGEEGAEARGPWLVRRALDIARGGAGNLPAPAEAGSAGVATPEPLARRPVPGAGATAPLPDDSRATAAPTRSPHAPAATGSLAASSPDQTIVAPAPGATPEGPGSAPAAPIAGSAPVSPGPGSSPAAPRPGGSSIAPVPGDSSIAPVPGDLSIAPVPGDLSIAPVPGDSTTPATRQGAAASGAGPRSARPAGPDTEDGR
ncbi:hypothetical protein [Oceanicella sp. SM1341]|uniref:DUF6931 family protein n=1 Tax=Oceanicella sp. SM1341 TaxID=1548889 RepID=UPI000E4FAD3E|nr:hypothetical protein [Oceanicella sp. SM1341]